MRDLARSIVAVTASCCAPAWAYASAVSSVPQIQHIIIIMQENRAFDHYFGTFPDKAEAA